MANTAPQTNEPGTFDSDGLPIHGLVIPGQTTMAAVAGAVLVTDPTSADQYTTPHLPTAAIPWNLNVQINNGVTLPQTTTQAAVVGRTLYLVGWSVEQQIPSVNYNCLIQFSPFSVNPGWYLNNLTTAPTSIARVFGMPLPVNAADTALTITIASTGVGTLNGTIRLNAWGFYL